MEDILKGGTIYQFIPLKELWVLVLGLIWTSEWKPKNSEELGGEVKFPENMGSLHPGRLIALGSPQMEAWFGWFSFFWVIFRFYVNFPGLYLYSQNPHAWRRNWFMIAASLLVELQLGLKRYKGVIPTKRQTFFFLAGTVNLYGLYVLIYCTYLVLISPLFIVIPSCAVVFVPKTTCHPPEVWHNP